MEGVCRFCENYGEGELFSKWVKPTFTNFDQAKEGTIVCNDCLFWFDESSALLQGATGKEKPQRMRNYSHFVVSGQWTPLSKGDKGKMKAMLLGHPFPELAVIADSGQKHLVFRAKRNEAGGAQGWVQFEEHSLWLEPIKLKGLLDLIEPALAIFSKGEIETGAYSQHRILQYGLAEFIVLEGKLKLHRGSLLFNLAIFLSQREETNGARSNEADGGGLDLVRMAGSANGLQTEVRADDLGTSRKQRERGGDLDQQPRQVRQLALF